MSHADPRIIVRKDAADLSAWLATEAGFLSTAEFNGEPLQLEGYQYRFLDDRSRFRWVRKGRQVGFSFIIAGEATARSHLRPGYIGNFVSYNREDAKEKINYARAFHDGLPLGYQKKLVRESLTELEFEDHSGKRSSRSRIISHPCKAPRGRRGDIYLDELAHYAEDTKVYNGSTALIARVPGAQVTGCSTPLGPRGLFWEIDTETNRAYPRHSRMFVPWWQCSAYCTNIGKAQALSEKLTAVQMVERFGTEAIREQFDGMVVEDFRQEFGGEYVDDVSRFYGYELLVPCMDPDLVVPTEVEDVDAAKILGLRLVAGYDVGRERDKSELAIFAQTPSGRYFPVMFHGFDKAPFAVQRAFLRNVLETLPIARMSVDSTGIGKQLAEELSAEFPQVEECVFTNESKERWCIRLKLLLQRRDIVLPASREVVAQFASIRRVVLPSGRVRYEGKTRHGHADRFWAIALAVQHEGQARRPRDVGIDVMVFR